MLGSQEDRLPCGVLDHELFACTSLMSLECGYRVPSSICIMMRKGKKQRECPMEMPVPSSSLLAKSYKATSNFNESQKMCSKFVTGKKIHA